MKMRFGFMLIILVPCWNASCQTVSPWQKEIDAAEKEMKAMAEATRGKLALTLRVKDSVGNVVTNAKTWVSIQRYGEKTIPVTGTTDTNGLFSVEKESTDSRILFIVEKDGYYRTEREFWFKEVARLEGSFEKRWMPWSPTIDVVLKEKRKPTPMHVFLSKRILFPKATTVGFDCRMGELTAPWGIGRQADFFLHYQSSVNPNAVTLREWAFQTNRLVLTTCEGGGFVSSPKDKFSDFWSLYEAPSTGYQTNIVYELERTSSKISKDQHFDDSKYLVYKSRVVKDEKGNVIKEHVGKIYRFSYGEEDVKSNNASVTLTYYFNPKINDKNLEAETSRNLASGQQTSGFSP